MSRAKHPPSPFKVQNLEITLLANGLVTPTAEKQTVTAIKACLITLLAKKNRLKLKKKGHYLIHLEMVPNEKMAKLNRIFRGKEGATDVLTFARWEVGMPALPLMDLGDVLIAPEVAREQAKRFHNTYPEELQRLAVHGLLHLFGYDHEVGPKEEKEMFELQERILKTL